MPQMIDYSGKSDRDLLVELVVQGNSSVEQGAEIVKHLSKLNGSVARNARDIAANSAKINERTVPVWMQSKRKLAGYSTLAISVASAIAVGVAEFIKCFA